MSKLLSKARRKQTSLNKMTNSNTKKEYRRRKLYKPIKIRSCTFYNTLMVFVHLEEGAILTARFSKLIVSFDKTTTKTSSELMPKTGRNLSRYACHYFRSLPASFQSPTRSFWMYGRRWRRHGSGSTAVMTGGRRQ